MHGGAVTVCPDPLSTTVDPAPPEPLPPETSVQAETTSVAAGLPVGSTTRLVDDDVPPGTPWTGGET